MINFKHLTICISILAILSSCSGSEPAEKEIAYNDSIEVFSWCYVFPKNIDTIGYSMCIMAQRKKYISLIQPAYKKFCIRDKVIIDKLYSSIFDKYSKSDSNSTYVPNARFLFLLHQKSSNDTLVVVNGRCIYNASSRALLFYNFNIFNKLKEFNFYKQLKSEFTKPT